MVTVVFTNSNDTGSRKKRNSVLVSFREFFQVSHTLLVFCDGCKCKINIENERNTVKG